MKRSFLDKMIISYLLVAVACFFVIVLFTNNNIDRIFITERTRNLQSQAQLIATQYVKQYFNKDINNVQLSTHLQSVETLLGTEIWIIDNQGQFIATSSQNKSLPVYLQDISEDIPTDTSFTMRGSFYNIFSGDMLSVGIPIYASQQQKGGIILHSSLDSLAETRTNVLHIAYLAFLIFMLFALLLFYHFSRSILIPLGKINATAMEYRNGNFEHKIKVDDRYEIGNLAESLNEMAEELSKMETYRRDFLANVSHDFRSPLTSIKGYIEAILDGTIPPELQEKYLTVVLNETQRLTKLTSGILDLKNFDNNSLILKQSIFDINETIRNTAQTFEVIASQRNVRISLDIADTPLKVYADSEKIKQVVYNLLDNAIKFSPENSTIFITTLLRSDKKVTISVKDSGVGIAVSEQKHIWDRFYKADTSRGKDKSGTGLGLSIVKEIIKAHNETIQLESKEGNGCNFTFTLTYADT